MKIAVAAETRDGEPRVAMVPELVGKLTGLGYDVAVEPGAGRHALLGDEEYVSAGATVEDDAIASADVVVSVQPLSIDRIRRLRRGAATVSFLPTGSEPEACQPFGQSSKCRCGPVASPVWPTRHSGAASATDWPSTTTVESFWQCAKNRSPIAVCSTT